MHYLSMKAMIAFREYFEKKLEGFGVQTLNLNERERIYILEDALVLFVYFAIDTLPVCTNAADFFSDYIDHPYLDFPVRSEQYFDLLLKN